MQLLQKLHCIRCKYTCSLTAINIVKLKSIKIILAVVFLLRGVKININNLRDVVKITARYSFYASFYTLQLSK